MNKRVFEVLLAEDNPGDVRLTKEALKGTKLAINLHTARDGMEAIAFLRSEGKYATEPHPDLILLDLNLPKKDGREVLAEIKSDPQLKQTPVVIVTTSNAEEDIVKTYALHANCYLTKPIELDQFVVMVQSIVHFWLTLVTLPNYRR
jgi:chemotaxis family two-component system response regulator Rcp1